RPFRFVRVFLFSVPRPPPSRALFPSTPLFRSFAYLMSLPPVASPRVEPALRFPYDSRFALQVWRALYFRPAAFEPDAEKDETWKDRKSTRLNSSHVKISYAVFCLKKKRRTRTH